MKLEYHPLFQADLEAAALYYLQEGGKDLADGFINEVEQGIHRILENPQACSKEFRSVRRLRLKRFNAYSIRFLFDEGSKTVLVANLLHGARHPGTGRDRF